MLKRVRLQLSSLKDITVEVHSFHKLTRSPARQEAGKAWVEALMGRVPAGQASWCRCGHAVGFDFYRHQASLDMEKLSWYCMFGFKDGKYCSFNISPFIRRPEKSRNVELPEEPLSFPIFVPLSHYSTDSHSSPKKRDVRVTGFLCLDMLLLARAAPGRVGEWGGRVLRAITAQRPTLQNQKADLSQR